jgi:hypothetical protein
MTETLARIEAMLRDASPLTPNIPPRAMPASPDPANPGPERAASPLPPREKKPGTIPNGMKAPTFPSTSTPDVGCLTSEAVHTLLFERIAAIQQERQTRWQRVLGLVMGR